MDGILAAVNIKEIFAAGSNVKTFFVAVCAAEFAACKLCYKLCIFGIIFDLTDNLFHL